MVEVEVKEEKEEDQRRRAEEGLKKEAKIRRDPKKRKVRLPPTRRTKWPLLLLSRTPKHQVERRVRANPAGRAVKRAQIERKVTGKGRAREPEKAKEVGKEVREQEKEARELEKEVRVEEKEQVGRLAKLEKARAKARERKDLYLKPPSSGEKVELFPSTNPITLTSEGISEEQKVRSRIALS